MTQSSAGWHPDPFGRFELRHWDGFTWTEHVATRGDQTTDPPGATPPVLEERAPQVPRGWHPDPLKRHELRYWDGSGWTEHVSSRGLQGVDAFTDAAAPTVQTPAPVVPSAKVPPELGVNRQSQRIQKQVQKAGLADSSGLADRAIFDESILVINQKGKLVELRAEFAIHDQYGRQLAAVRGKRMSSRMQVVDMQGRQLLELRREGSVLSSKVAVSGENGAKIGRIVPSWSMKDVDRAYKIEGASDMLIGAVFSEARLGNRPRHRHREFNVQDANSTVVARISKTRAGVAKELLTKGDNYVLSIPGSLPDPLRSISIAVVLTIDAAYHQ